MYVSASVLVNGEILNLLHVAYIIKGLGSRVVIRSGYGLDNRGVEVRVQVESRIFTFPYRPDWLWASPSLLNKGVTVGGRGSFPGGNGSAREADHSPPTRAEVKKT
jgi:hypothetical protein